MKQPDKPPMKVVRSEKDPEQAPELEYDTENVSYFGYTERPFFERMSAWRFRFFHPILGVLTKLGIRATHITGASFLVILVGFPLFFWKQMYFWAFAALAVHIILDGLDGPLANYQEDQSPAGAFLDMSNDLTGMVIVLITAAHWDFLNPTIAFMYVVAYLYLTFVAVAQNALKLPFRFVMKTKYPVYVLLAFRAATGVDITTWFCIFLTAYMVAHVAMSSAIVLDELNRRHKEGK